MSEFDATIRPLQDIANVPVYVDSTRDSNAIWTSCVNMRALMGVSQDHSVFVNKC